ncbi:MAG: HAD-IIIA family hydrolase [Eubacteriales bacterium]|nr:HAD-IIIA family hydrolase [Eubacteriales bacterium]
MKKAVIFDLDGTLLYTLEDLCSAVNAALALRNLPPRSLEEVRRFVGNGVRNLMRRALPAGTAEAEIDAALADFKRYYATHIRDATVPYDGIPELLTALRKRGIKVGVLSNKIDSAAQELIHSFFPGKVDVIFGEHKDIPRKPDPASCKLVMQQLGVKPEEVLYVGDSGTDMQTAKNAALTAVGVTWGFRNREELVQYGADCLVDTPKQILLLLE